MSRGVIMFAHNNEKVDYFKIAVVNSLMVRKNLRVPVSVVVDQKTYNNAKAQFEKKFLDKLFDNIIVDSSIDSNKRSNRRTYRDANKDSSSLQFLNYNHYKAYELSPYDETLFIDADYLIQSDALKCCWGSVHNFMICDNMQEAYFNRESISKWIDPFSIRLYWATVVYFKKSLEAKSIFDKVKHVLDNYNFYKQRYNFPNGMFRNDWAFAIAVHEYNGFKDCTLVPRIPLAGGLLKVFDHDDLISVNGINDLVFMLQAPDAGGFVLSNVKDVDVHVMNKFGLLRNSDKLIEIYKESLWPEGI